MHAVWLIMEQVVMAALDVKELGLALTYIKEIKDKFPKSQRCIRLSVSVLRAWKHDCISPGCMEESQQRVPCSN